MMRKLGEGGAAEVFSLDARHTMKLFHSGFEWKADLEARATSLVSASGAPAPRVVRLVQIDGRRGIVFAVPVQGETFYQRICSKSWQMLGAAREMAELHADLHRRSVPGLPSQRASLEHDIRSSKTLPADIIRLALRQLRDLPEDSRLCHNDFHWNNIIVGRSGERLVVDWSLAKAGDPLSDVLKTILSLQTDGRVRHPLDHGIRRCVRALFLRTYVRWYLRMQGVPYRQLMAWQLPVAAAYASRAVHALRRQQLLAIIRRSIACASV